MADGSLLPWPSTGGKALPRNRSSPGSRRESLQHEKRPKPSPWSRAQLGSGRNLEIRADESDRLNFRRIEGGHEPEGASDCCSPDCSPKRGAKVRGRGGGGKCTCLKGLLVGATGFEPATTCTPSRGKCRPIKRFR